MFSTNKYNGNENTNINLYYLIKNTKTYE